MRGAVTGTLLFCFMACAAVAQEPQPMVMGWVENVYIEAIDAKLKAKLDTGAKTSSIRAEVLNIVRPATKPGHKKPKRHVIFQIEDADGKKSTLERRLEHWVRIKDRRGGYLRRPVVKMEFCMGGHLVDSEVNLSPRIDMIYPVLVGRNMLQDAHIAVDVSQTFTSEARCPQSTDTAKVKDEE